MSIFDQISELPPDPIFGLTAQFRKDPRPDKYTFITGYYCDETLETPLLETVAEVEDQLAREKQTRKYLPIDGDQEFVDELEKLIFGAVSDKICGVQTIGGTGALYLMGRLAAHFTDQIAISNPTWANHWGIFFLAGLKTVGYPYYSDKQIQFEQMVEKLSSLPKGACVLIHTSCHNPTGLDLSKTQWQELSTLIKKKGLFPILDMAYQGFGDTPEEDAYAARLFLKDGHEFALTYTCAKNFSIYGERAGALYVIGDLGKSDIIRSQIKREIRGSYSNPPMHAASIVKEILKDSTLKSRWYKELEIMRKRMKNVRGRFIDLLSSKKPQENWERLKEGKGLFFYSEKTPAAVDILRQKGFYIAADGRINLTGLNDQNIDPFINTFLEL